MDTEHDIKPQLRRSLLDMRSALADTVRQQWDSQISAHLEPYLETLTFTTLGIYLSVRNEPDMMTLYTKVSQSGIILSLPVVTASRAPLQFARWAPGDPLTPDRFGIPTPEVKDFIALPELLLIPCLGFTQDRFRLGYGGGFYDRTLEKQPRPHTIGISYSCLKTDFPTRKYDIPLDSLITENGIL